MPLPTIRGVRRAALLVAVAMLVLLPGRAVAQPGRVEGYPGLDLTVALAALETGPVFRAPGAPALFDESRVLPLVGPTARILLAPYSPLDYGATRFVEEVMEPIRDWAFERDLDVVLVTGLGVRVLSAGVFGPTTLDGVRATLAHHDVTAELELALEYVRSGLEHLDDPPTRPVPPDPAELATVLAGLSTSRVFGGLADGPWLDQALPGGAVRVVALPALPLGAPDPELLAAVVAAFPDDVVVVLRDRWIEAAGPDPEVASARDYVLGRYADFLTQRQVEPQAIARLFLERLALLRSGEPFGRPQPGPVSVEALAGKWTPWVLGAAACVLGGGSVLVAVLRARRRVEVAQADLRRERALAVAELAELDAELLEDPPPSDGANSAALRADAAERTATAHTLLEHAQDADEVRAARDAVAKARALTGRA